MTKNQEKEPKEIEEEFMLGQVYERLRNKSEIKLKPLEFRNLIKEADGERKKYGLDPISVVEMNELKYNEAKFDINTKTENANVSPKVNTEQKIVSEPKKSPGNTKIVPPLPISHIKTTINDASNGRNQHLTSRTQNKFKMNSAIRPVCSYFFYLLVENSIYIFLTEVLVSFDMTKKIISIMHTY